MSTCLSPAERKLNKAIKEISKNVIDVQCRAVQGSVGSLTDLDRLFEIVKKEKGRIDVIFESAVFLTSLCARYNKKYTIKSAIYQSLL